MPAPSIAPHLPYLRRFARALVGSQEGGDAYVMATLEAILARGQVLSAALAPRVALYQVFLRIWGSVAVNRAAHETDDERDDARSAADRNIETITPLPRLAFLLCGLEEFSLQEAASILERSDAEVAALIERAGREIAAQLSTDVLIIEDHPMISMDLEAIVGDLGHRVVRVARTHGEALEAIAERPPGLVLADVHLADGSSGLNAVNDVLGYSAIPVVFITAFPEYVLTGEGPEPTFLIVKPYRNETVKIMISQALFFGCAARRAEVTAA